MLVRIGVLLPLAVAAVSHSAGAVDLEGFGPIKFGMTKEQAWNAIKGKGKWTHSGNLQYTYPSDFLSAELKVWQEFEDDHATNASIEHVVESGTPEHCLSKGVFIAAVIEMKYAVAPSARHGSVEPGKPLLKGGNDYVIQDMYAFAFENNAGIQMIARYGYHRPQCLISFRYSPPSDHVVPF